MGTIRRFVTCLNLNPNSSLRNLNEPPLHFNLTCSLRNPFVLLIKLYLYPYP